MVYQISSSEQGVGAWVGAVSAGLPRAGSRSALAGLLRARGAWGGTAGAGHATPAYAPRTPLREAPLLPAWWAGLARLRLAAAEADPCCQLGARVVANLVCGRLRQRLH